MTNSTFIADHLKMRGQTLADTRPLHSFTDTLTIKSIKSTIFLLNGERERDGEVVLGVCACVVLIVMVFVECLSIFSCMVTVVLFSYMVPFSL